MLCLQKIRRKQRRFFKEKTEKTKKIKKSKRQGRIQGGAMGAKPPLDLCNLLISGGFQAPTGAEPHPGK